MTPLAMMSRNRTESVHINSDLLLVTVPDYLEQTLQRQRLPNTLFRVGGRRRVTQWGEQGSVL